MTCEVCGDPDNVQITGEDNDGDGQTIEADMSEWLSMRVHIVPTLQSVPKEEIAAHVLYAMCFNSVFYSQS